MRHRRPPLPATFTNKRVPGFCRWCGLEIVEKGKRLTRRSWHPECVTAYFIATSSTAQRRALWERDKGVCRQCGLDTLAKALSERPEWYHAHLKLGVSTSKYWQADHVVALINAERDLKFWTLENLQTLCTECHKKKTKQDICEARRLISLA